MEDGCALHQGADEVVGDNVEEEFFLDHRGCQAAQDVEGECDFDLPELEFHVPAFQVKGSDGPGGIEKAKDDMSPTGGTRKRGSLHSVT